MSGTTTAIPMTGTAFEEALAGAVAAYLAAHPEVPA